MASLKSEIAQEVDFSGIEEETLLNLMRTTDCLERAVQRTTREFGITATQYNVLRILRGAQPQGLTCSAIGSRMITSDPDITRLLNRLKILKLVRQQRDKHDRRVVWTHISEAGLDLLRQMEPTVHRMPKELLGHLTAAELSELTRLLELARRRCSDRHGSVSCDGTAGTAEQVCDAGPA
jgi:DNA-binding MarR family transcriptional regulator